MPELVNRTNGALVSGQQSVKLLYGRSRKLPVLPYEVEHEVKRLCLITEQRAYDLNVGARNPAMKQQA
jgi:hypothetical protein